MKKYVLKLVIAVVINIVVSLLVSYLVAGERAEQICDKELTDFFD